jgi:hypothetical protein
MGFTHEREGARGVAVGSRRTRKLPAVGECLFGRRPGGEPKLSRSPVEGDALLPTAVHAAISSNPVSGPRQAHCRECRFPMHRH